MINKGSGDSRATRPRQLDLHPIARWATRGTIVILSLAVVCWSVLKDFNCDEIEAVHSAWKILKGELIYGDFFQHHHPLLYIYLAPVIAIYGEHPATFVACRLAMLPFLAGIVAATYVLGRRVFSTPAATLGVLLVLASLPLIRAVEIRPDVPQVMFGMIALVLLFGRREVGGKGVYLYLLIGICLGLSLLFLQKAVFLIVGVVLIAVWRIRSREAECAALFALLAGIAVTVIPFLLWLAVHQMVHEYLFLNWTLNAHFQDHFSFLGTLRFVCKYESVTVAFAVAACMGCLSDRRQWQLAFLAALLAGSVATVRAPYLQYWIPTLPLVAILAGHGLVKLLRRRRKMLSILLVYCAVIPFSVGAHSTSNVGRLKMIGYVLKVTNPGDCVYDGDAQFNLFRDDIDWFWYSVGEHRALGTYQSLRPYEYDVYDRIDRMKPKVISSYKIENLADPRIQRHYTRSEQYDFIFIRKE